METLIEEAPYLGAVVIVVGMFVGAWWKQQRLQAHESKRRDEFDLARMVELERIGSACHDHTRELNQRSNTAIDNASRVIEANTKIIGAVERRMNGGL